MVGAKLAEALTWLAVLLQGMITSSLAILNILSLVIVTPIVTFFLLRDWEKMVAQIDSYLPRPVARNRARAGAAGQRHAGRLLSRPGADLPDPGDLLRRRAEPGGADSGLALGVLIGVLAIIPILGVATGFILAISLAASQYGTWTAILVVGAIFAVGQLVEANILTPKLLGDRIHLHPVWVIFALFAGGTLFGFVGVLLAVPAAAVIGVLAIRGAERRRT